MLAVLMGRNVENQQKIEPLFENIPGHLVKLGLWASSMLSNLVPKGNPDPSGEMFYDYNLKFKELLLGLSDPKSELLNNVAIIKASFKVKEFTQMVVALTCKQKYLLHLSTDVDTI